MRGLILHGSLVIPVVGEEDAATLGELVDVIVQASGDADRREATSRFEADAWSYGRPKGSRRADCLRLELCRSRHILATPNTRSINVLR
jgi:hypothetical protein